MPEKQYINEHLYADEILVNDNLAVEGGRYVVGSVWNSIAGFQMQDQKRSARRGLLRSSVTYHTVCIGTMKMTRGFGGTCFDDQTATVCTFAVGWPPLISLPAKEGLAHCRHAFGGRMNRPPSISRKILGNDPDRLVLSTVDHFVRNPSDVEVLYL